MRGLPCIICGRPSDPCHIKSVGSGGDDVEDNLISMCRQHHIEQHAMNWNWMKSRYPDLAIALAKKIKT